MSNDTEEAGGTVPGVPNPGSGSEGCVQRQTPAWWGRTLSQNWDVYSDGRAEWRTWVGVMKTALEAARREAGSACNPVIS